MVLEIYHMGMCLCYRVRTYGYMMRIAQMALLGAGACNLGRPRPLEPQAYGRPPTSRRRKRPDFSYNRQLKVARHVNHAWRMELKARNAVARKASGPSAYSTRTSKACRRPACTSCTTSEPARGSRSPSHGPKGLVGCGEMGLPGRERACKAP